MIEKGLVVELSNQKKYIIADSSREDGSVYYMALETDAIGIPKENAETVFFKQCDNQDELLPVTDENDLAFLQTVFIDKFINDLIEEGEYEN